MLCSCLEKTFVSEIFKLEKSECYKENNFECVNMKSLKTYLSFQTVVLSRTVKLAYLARKILAMPKL
jgi:hypothetical protein